MSTWQGKAQDPRATQLVTSLNETREVDEEQMIRDLMGHADAGDGDPVFSHERTDSFSHAFDQFTGGEDGYDPVELGMSGTKESYLLALEQKDRQSQHQRAALQGDQMWTPSQMFGAN